MFKFKRQLKKTVNQFEPRKDFKKALWSELSREFDAEYRPARGFHFKLAALPTLAIVLLFGLGTGTYAYASPDVGDGHVLFPVKRGMEEIERQIHFSKKGKAQFKNKLLERRLLEAERLNSAREHRLDRLERVAEYFGMTVEELKELNHNPRARKEFIEGLSEEERTYLRRLEIQLKEGELNEIKMQEGFYKTERPLSNRPLDRNHYSFKVQ